MAATVVTSQNLVEFVTTGKVPAFKPPETPRQDGTASAAPVETKEASPSAQSRGADGKFTSPTQSGTNPVTPAQPAKAPAGEDDIEGSDDLPENLRDVVRRAVGKKHRQMKEAEEFARSEFRARTAAEDRAARLQAELDAQKKPKSQPSAAEAPKEPKPADFATVAEYTEALVDFRVDQRLHEEKAKRQREAEEQAEADRMREFGRKIAAYEQKQPDFRQVLSSIKGTDLERVHKDVTEYIQEADQGPELLYHLAKNPDVLGRLQKLSPRQFIAELGKLEVKLGAAEPETKSKETSTLSAVAAPAEPAVSKAPAPISPLASGMTPVAKKPEDMSVSELREHRRLEALQKRNRR